MADDVAATTNEAMIIEGEDGSVYVIPGDQLGSFRVSDDVVAHMKKGRVEMAEVAGFASPSKVEFMPFAITVKGPFERRMGEHCVPPVLHVYNYVKAPNS